MSEIPKFIAELTALINRMPYSPEWRRLRIAMSTEELDEYRTYISNNIGRREFVHAIRGVPIQHEAYPMNPLFTLEHLEGWTNDE